MIINLTMMDPDQAQRAVDFIAGGTYAIDGHQEMRKYFPFCPKLQCNSSSSEEASPSNVSSNNTSQYSLKITLLQSQHGVILNYAYS